MSRSVAPLAAIARQISPKPVLGIEPSGAMPPFVLLASWPEGTKIWRAMDGIGATTVRQHAAESAMKRVDWKKLDYDTGKRSFFVVTVALEGHDLPLATFSVVRLPPYEDSEVEALVLTELEVMRPSVYIDDPIKNTPIPPRFIGGQVGWFLLDVIGVDPNTTLSQKFGDWRRLGIPLARKDTFFEPNYPVYGRRKISLRESFDDRLGFWKDRARLLPAYDVARTPEVNLVVEDLQESARKMMAHMWPVGDHQDGPFDHVTGGGTRGSSIWWSTKLGGEGLDLTLNLTSFKPGIWSATWSADLSDGYGSTLVKLQESDIGPIDLLVKNRLIVPESQWESWLDTHLVPGQIHVEDDTFEAYALVGEDVLLARPEILWAAVGGGA